MQGNITRVTANGENVGRYTDLDDFERFDAVTDAGNEYVVRRTGSTREQATDWEVTRSRDSVIVGRVHSPAPLVPFLVSGSSYFFTRDGHVLSSGKQGDLWNAVQALME